MDAREANVFLAKVRLLDPRWPVSDDPVAQADVWAETLHDVRLRDAIEAAVDHYRGSTMRLMPANVVSRCAAFDPEVARARAEWMRRHGLTEAQLSTMPRDELEQLVRQDRQVTR